MRAKPCQHVEVARLDTDAALASQFPQPLALLARAVASVDVGLPAGLEVPAEGRVLLAEGDGAVCVAVVQFGHAGL